MVEWSSNSAVVIYRSFFFGRRDPNRDLCCLEASTRLLGLSRSARMSNMNLGGWEEMWWKGRWWWYESKRW